MFLNKIQDIRFPKPYHCPRFSFAVARTFPPDTRQLAPVCHLVNQWQAAFEDLADLFRTKDLIFVI
jgi:hypothetical protein